MNIIKTTTAPSGPGIYYGLSNEAYHAGPGISKSSLDVLAKTPADFHDRYLAANRVQQIETPAMAFGTAFHTAVLEPDVFARYVVLDKVDRRTKAGQAAHEDAIAKAAEQGGRVISREDFDLISAMSSAVARHPAAEIFKNGQPELSVYWIDEDTGVLCRCRPDWLGAGVILDLKTTDDASPAEFTRSAYNYRYWVQAAFYLDGLAANNVWIKDFVFLAVQKKRPHHVIGYEAAYELIEAGRKKYKSLLHLYSDCAGSGLWPGYPEWSYLTLPVWAGENFSSDMD